MPLDVQYVTLTAPAAGLKVRGLRGTVAPSPTGGFGGWTQVARPRRKALTQWDGVPPLEVAFSLILDGVAGDRSVEADCLALEQMAQPAAARTPPPVVRANGGIPHAELDWVISDLQWDPAPIYATSKKRIRQEVTVHLLEHVAADTVAAPAAAAAAKAGGGTKLYVVKAGDTLSSIAAKLLGDHKKWTQIAAINGIRDPKAIRPGQKLRIP